MRKLSMTDASFLFTERRSVPMHVAGLQIFELPENYEGDFAENVKAVLASRIEEIPVFQERVVMAPLNIDYPVWVKDENFDIDRHVHKTAIPKGGTLDDVVKKIGRLHSHLMDRERPLFEYYIIEGLPGRQIAIYSKVHHACIDGQAGQKITQLLYDTEPTPAPILHPKKEDKEPEAIERPRLTDFVVSAIRDRFENPLFRTIPKMLRATRKLNEIVNDKGTPEANKPFSAPKTRFNVGVSAQREVAVGTISLSMAKDIRKATGATLNEILTAACGGALRRYLEEKGELPEKSLVCGAPVALPSDDGDFSNNVTMMMMTYGSDEADPLKRLEKVHESSEIAKNVTNESKDLVSMQPPAYLAAMLAYVISQKEVATSVAPPINVVFSNVPGSRVPLYVAGAKMLAYYPVSIVVHGQAMNITVQSYMDSLDFGITACRTVMPDADKLFDYIKDAFDELYAAVFKQAEKAVEPAATKARPKATTTKRATKQTKTTAPKAA
ncbi:MAG: wax ester/triacylglycerol synthase family O-acyltransferase [Pseudomonadota bacterium]